MRTLNFYAEKCEAIQRCEPGSDIIRFTGSENDSFYRINNGLGNTNVETETREKYFINPGEK